MKLIEIAAHGKSHELGLKGDMPWGHALKKDLKFFSSQTKGQTMLMGRKTLESLPKLLPGRRHIVLSSAKDELSRKYAQALADGQMEIYSSLQDFMQAYEHTDHIVYVIGGASLYKQLLDQADELLLTEIDGDFDADTWFPFFDSGLYTRQVLDEQEDGGYQTRHVRWSRIPTEQ